MGLDRMSKKIYAGSEDGIHYATELMNRQGWDAEGGVDFESKKFPGSDDEFWFYTQTVVRKLQSPFR